VEQVELGLFDEPATRRLVRCHLEPLIVEGADTIILGCTHYPFLRAIIEEEAGHGIEIIDTGPAVARQLQRRLTEDGLLDEGTTDGSMRFFTTGEVEPMKQLLDRLCHGECPVDILTGH
ncbi:MAG: glutamate racemase, partial [Gammaproteobacteria bacterium]